jgi:hypothetical protein
MQMKREKTCVTPPHEEDRYKTENIVIISHEKENEKLKVSIRMAFDNENAHVSPIDCGS